MRATVLAHKRSRELRRRLTAPETRLWVRLRSRRDDEPVFRRQHPCGVYILDFYCPAARLAVEVDGYVHGTEGQPEHDQRRDRWLTSQGIHVHRIPAVEVMKDPDEIALGIRALARSLLPRKAGEGDHAQHGGGGDGRQWANPEAVEPSWSNAPEAAAPSTAEPVLGSAFGRARGRSPSPVARGRR